MHQQSLDLAAPMHHAITSNDMIERVIFVRQAFRIPLPEPDVGMVRHGLGAEQRCCKVT
jgi:hypothetical protein